jgi:hypothetical protein
MRKNQSLVHFPRIIKLIIIVGLCFPSSHPKVRPTSNRLDGGRGSSLPSAFGGQPGGIIVHTTARREFLTSENKPNRTIDIHYFWCLGVGPGKMVGQTPIWGVHSAESAFFNNVNYQPRGLGMHPAPKRCRERLV